MEKTKKNLSFLQKIENFWYYYKWWVVLGILVIAAIAVYAQLVNENKKPADGDLTVISVFSHPLTAESYDIDQRLTDVITDANGNGETKVVLNPYYITEKRASDEDRLSESQFENDLSHCRGDILLFDEPNRDYYIKKDIFEPIENYVDLSEIPAEDIVYRDGVAVAVKLTESKILSDMKFIIDEVYASVMFIPDNPDESLLKSRENTKAALKKLLEKSTPITD